LLRCIHISRFATQNRLGENYVYAYRRLTLIAGLLLAAGSAAAQGGPPQATPVTVSEPVAKRVVQWDEYSGRFEARAVVEIRARVSGFVEKLHFKDGEWVKEGDKLFTIDKRPYEIAVDVAQADVARNKAQVDLAGLQVQRGAALVASRNIPEAENDSRKSILVIATMFVHSVPEGIAIGVGYATGEVRFGSAVTTRMLPLPRRPRRGLSSASGTRRKLTPFTFGIP